MENKSELLQFAIELAKKSGKILLEYYEKDGLNMKSKGYNNLVTEADTAAENLIVEEIKKKYPDNSILAEESGIYETHGSHRWIIDPLDGTSNFSHSLPIFAVSIGLEINGEIVLGVVFTPRINEIFYAEKSKGAWMNDKPIHVSLKEDYENSMFSTGFPYEKELRKGALVSFNNVTAAGHQIRRLGAASVDLCYVACGRLDAFWELSLAPWDMAAGKLIVEEAGGKITKADGSPFEITSKSIAASNGKMHPRLLELLRS